MLGRDQQMQGMGKGNKDRRLRRGVRPSPVPTIKGEHGKQCLMLTAEKHLELIRKSVESGVK